MKRLCDFIAHRWWIVLLIWVLILILLRVAAPSWDSVTKDGDFEYLPERCPSVAGQKLLDQAFSLGKSKSQIVLITATESPEPTELDLLAATDIARRTHSLAAEALLAHAKSLKKSSTNNSADSDARVATLERAKLEIQSAIESYQSMFNYSKLENQEQTNLYFSDDSIDPLSSYVWIQSLIAKELGSADATELETQAKEIDAKVADFKPRFDGETAAPAQGVWTWNHEIFGEQLQKSRNKKTVARLVVFHLDSEFLAVENTKFFESLQSEIEEVKKWVANEGGAGIQIGISGSAAIGSDLLKASAEGVSHTELFSVLLVTLILAVVYRSPLMVLVPLITIGVSFSVAISLIAIMTQLGSIPGFSWWDFEVFKTTKIFIVVILFGAGTDYCLFLIARLRESMEANEPPKQGVSNSLFATWGALTASSMTTVLGLGMMFFAEFGKLRNSGPAIGFAIFVTLACCLTLTPALLAAFGDWVFWPTRRKQQVLNSNSEQVRKSDQFWVWITDAVLARPGLVLIVSTLVLAWPAYHGYRSIDAVTYDILGGLDRNRISRDGTELLKKYFSLGESAPIHVLIQMPPESFVDSKGRINLERGTEVVSLTERFSKIPGVAFVRSLQTPLGNRKTINVSAQQVAQNLPIARMLFIGQAEETQISRLDIILEGDVFSQNATEVVSQVWTILEEESKRADGTWGDAKFHVAGTTAAIRDLRDVTTSDNLRIEILVVLAVFVVLLALLRHPIICLYMILTVLFSFYVTVGLTDWFFAWGYGNDYLGLEWKVPLFLFVILVAVGEDYNVYLAARVFEEQRHRTKLDGLRVAMYRTGGIISSCGLIMAGTFVSMTSPVWHWFVPDQFAWLDQSLRTEHGSIQGLIQMGFALTLGVSLDTFVVRPILLPTYLALTYRWTERRVNLKRAELVNRSDSNNELDNSERD